MTRVRVRPGPGPLLGTVRVPGDKSIAHRAVLIGAVADGTQVVHGAPRGADVRASIAAVRALGAAVEEDGDVLRIRGAGARFGTGSGVARVDCANSGTTMRLLAGLVAGCGRPVVLDGDASLRQRPMERVAAPLRAMGAAVETAGGRPPLRLEGRALRAVDWTLPVASAQVKSAVLLAGLGARGRTRVREPGASRDHTERLLQAMGVRVEREDGWIALDGGQRPQAVTVPLPGDPSSAAFLVVAACLVPGSRLTVADVCLNPTRDGFVRVLARMGGRVAARGEALAAGEPRGDLATEAAPLHGTTIGGAEIPACIDELPVLAVAAACATGETRITDAAELRVKESDRLAALGQLAALGVDVQVLPDGVLVRGRTGPLAGARVSAHGDHRIAMAFAVAALRAPEGVEIDDAGAVDVSFPGFFELLASLGASVEWQA